MSKDYKVLQFKKGDFQDINKNYWCDMALEGVSEPVRIVVKDPSQFHNDMTLYGHITEETSKAGKAYLRFRREQKPDGQQSLPSTAPQGGKPDEAYWEDKNSAIKAQWAIGKALSKFEEGCYKVSDGNRATLLANIEDFAKELYAMVDRVKGSSESTDPKATTTSVEEQLAQEQARRDEKDFVHAVDEGTPINLDDIPF